MQEISIKKNPLGLKIFINGVPDVKQISPDEKDLLLSSLHLEILEQFKKKRSKKQSEEPP